MRKLTDAELRAVSAGATKLMRKVGLGGALLRAGQNSETAQEAIQTALERMRKVKR
jgi:hypothetical protein